MACTIPAAKAALQALLIAHTWPTSAPVITWGGPTQAEDFPQGGELIYFGDTEMQDESPTLGQTRIDEEFSVRIIIDVQQWGDNEQATEQRAWDLYSEVVSVVNANRTLSGTVQRTTERTVRQTNLPTPEQWLSRIVVEQGCVGMVFNP
jgi:hypothetical protein